LGSLASANNVLLKVFLAGIRHLNFDQYTFTLTLEIEKHKCIVSFGTHYISLTRANKSSVQRDR